MGTRLQTCNLQSTCKETCQRSLGTTQSNWARNWWQQWWIICWNYRRSQYTSFANRKIIYKQVNLVNLQALLGVAATNLIYVGLTSSDTGWATSCRFAPQMLVFLNFPGPLGPLGPLGPGNPRDALRAWEGSCLASAGASTASNIFWSSSFRIALQEGSLRELKFVKFVKVYKLYNAKVFTKTTKTCYIMLWLLWAGLWLFWAQIIMGWHVVDWFVMEFENVIHSGWALWKARVFSKYVLDSWLTFTDILFLLAEWKKNL